MESSTQIEEHALAWLARRDSDSWSELDENELEAWLQAETAHRVAFLRVEAGWERGARLKAFGVGNKTGTVPPPGAWRAAPFFERRPAAPSLPATGSSKRWAAASAAGLAVIAGAAFYFGSSKVGDGYMTPVGGVAAIPLPDGSQITLNTASKVRVVLTESERRIELQAGEAFFDVAKDPRRPFIVEAGHRRVVAVGTQFSVRREGASVQVVVTDGKVRLEREAGPEGAGLLAAGSVARMAEDTVLVQKKTLHEAEEALSWRSGYLTFDETSLADAVAEFNRYTARKITIADPKLAALRINGKFRSTNSDDFILLLRTGFDVQVRETGDALILTAN